MQKPSKSFEFEGSLYPLDSPVPRVGAAMIQQEFDKLLTSYSHGVRELSAYGGERFGELDSSTQYVSFSTDSPEALINFIRENHRLEPISGSAVFKGYGSISRVKFIKPCSQVEQEVKQLEALAETSVKDSVARFKVALSDAKKAAQDQYIAYQNWLETEKLKQQAESEDEAKFFGGLH